MTELSISIANYMISAVNKWNEGKELRDTVFMSAKRLQKLLYFANALYMVENEGDVMFEDEFYAWPSGPVIPSLYREFMQYQDGEMQPVYGREQLSSPKIQNICDRILEGTSSLDTILLVRASQVLWGPWHIVFDESDTDYKNTIDPKCIYNYYKKYGVPYVILANKN